MEGILNGKKDKDEEDKEEDVVGRGSRWRDFFFQIFCRSSYGCEEVTQQHDIHT